MKRTMILAAVAVGLLAAVPAQAGKTRLIDSSSDSGSDPSPNAYSFGIESPKRISYRVVMDPQVPAEGEVDITCYRKKRDVGREIPWSSATSFAAAIPLTLPKPESCSVDVTFAYEDYEQVGTATLELFAKTAKRP